MDLAREEDPVTGSADIQDRDLAESFNQRLKELSTSATQTLTGPLTGLVWSFYGCSTDFLTAMLSCMSVYTGTICLYRAGLAGCD